MIVYFIALLFRLSTDTENRDNFYHLFLIAFSAIGLATYHIWAIWLGKLFVLLARAIFDLEEGNIIAEYLGAFFSNQDGSGLRLSLLNLFSLRHRPRPKLLKKEVCPIRRSSPPAIRKPLRNSGKAGISNILSTA